MDQKYCVHCMTPASGDICDACGKSAAAYQLAPHHLQPGTVLGGKYVVGAVLGEGGFGITYIGREINLDIKVAIKEYFPFGIVNRNNTSSSEITAHVGDAQEFFEKGKSSFLGEARTLAKFSSEPSIVSVRDFFSENNTAYIVMEYLEGIDLKDHIKQQGQLSFAQTVTMLTPVMKALSKIHAQGLIHRDISPANIMILKDGTVKLLDFGAAREVGGADEKSLSILLKPGFAPEEQYRTKGRQGPWTDVYALSATMYKMLTGLTPIDAMNRVFSDDLRKITDMNPGVTAAQEAIILKGMAVHQADRYQTIDELCAACQLGTAANEDDERTVAEAGGWTPTWQTPQIQTKPRTGAVAAKEKPQEQPRQEKPRQEKPRQEKPRQENAAAQEKKPSIPAFIGSVITGFLALYFILNTASLIIDEESYLFSALLAVLFGVAAFFLGRLYFPRIDNKNRKPNVICLIASILAICFTLFCAWTTYMNFSDPWAEEGTGEFSAVMTVVSLALPIFFGYFYYPRLTKKKLGLFMKIYGGIAAAAVAIFVIGIVFTSANTVTIGDKVIERDATTVHLSLDILTDQDLQKLKELKLLESLEIFECFLDDADVKTIGELTQLKQLSLRANTDITDVSPLNNLTQLTYLDISFTKTADITCLDKLVNLESLNISDTPVNDLSVLSSYTKLDTLKMDSMDGLDASTIALPASLSTLYCNSNGLSSLDFVSVTESLTNIYAANNNISDLTPLSPYSLYTVDLSANQITDLSPLDIQDISTLDVSTNAITDISCLAGIPAYSLDLAYNQISDISPLADNYRLGIVKLNNNQITDISPLKDCFNISFLYLSYNQIEDISALATIDKLHYLQARGNRISDISPLASCPKLIESDSAIDLRDNQITNIDALSHYVNTKYLYLSGNQITDISPLKNCKALETLRLNNNQITDVSALNGLPALYVLELVNNPISSLDQLDLSGYENSWFDTATLRISYNENIDYEALSQVEHLSVSIYGVPPRQQEALRSYKFHVYMDFSALDEVEANPDLPEEEDTQEESNG